METIAIVIAFFSLWVLQFAHYKDRITCADYMNQKIHVSALDTREHFNHGHMRLKKWNNDLEQKK